MEEELHRLIRERVGNGEWTPACDELWLMIEARVAGQVEMLEGANDGWQRRAGELEMERDRANLAFAELHGSHRALTVARDENGARFIELRTRAWEAEQKTRALVLVEIERRIESEERHKTQLPSLKEHQTLADGVLMALRGLHDWLRVWSTVTRDSAGDAGASEKDATDS